MPQLGFVENSVISCVTADDETVPDIGSMVGSLQVTVKQGSGLISTVNFLVVN